jgi:cytochrome c-type biogenesis protein CcmH
MDFQLPDPALGSPDMETLVEQLRGRLRDDPDQVEGWVLLGRSYKSLRQYPEALEALETANRLEPNQPFIEVELVEAQLFASGNPRISPEMKSTLEKAVAADPGMQKGIWLLGIEAAQSGEDQKAIELWQQLLVQLEPGSEVAASVEGQIAEARGRLGTPAPAESPDAWPGLAITVALEPGTDPVAELPPEAVLFIIARAEGVEGGPPLGVKRVERPRFPVEVKLGDQDSMLPQQPISSRPVLRLQARLSMQGQALPASGDWETSAMSVPRDSTDPVVLSLVPRTN